MKTNNEKNVQPLAVLHGYEGGVNALGLLSDAFLTAGNDHTLRLWDIVNYNCLAVFKIHKLPVTTLCVLPGGKYVLSGSNDKTIKLLHIQSRKVVHTFEGHEDNIKALAVSADGKLGVSGSMDCTIRLWYFTTNSCFKILEAHPAV
jgi:WD40 repeat protein